MAKKLIIFAVLVILAQISLAVKLTTALSSNGPSGSKKRNKSQDETILKNIQAEEKKSITAVTKGTELLYKAIENGECEIDGGTRNGSSLVTKKLFTDESAAYQNDLIGIFKGIVIAEPETSSIVENVRCAAYAGVKSSLISFKEGIDLINKESCTEVEIEEIEKKAIPVALGVVNRFYVAMLNGRESSCSTGAKIITAREKSFNLITKVFKLIFKAIKLLLTKVFTKLHFEDLDSSDSIKSLKKESVATFVELNESVFAGIHVVFTAVPEKHDGTCEHM